MMAGAEEPATLSGLCQPMAIAMVKEFASSIQICVQEGVARCRLKEGVNVRFCGFPSIDTYKPGVVVGNNRVEFPEWRSEESAKGRRRETSRERKVRDQRTLDWDGLGLGTGLGLEGVGLAWGVAGPLGLTFLHI